MNNEKIFKSSDLSLVAALCVAQFVVEEIERESFNRAVFVFENSDELKQVVKQYWRGEMRVEPQAFFNQLKILKARIYER